MDILDRKILINEKLAEMGYGAKKLLADHCGVDLRQVGRWTSLETTAWPKLENEIKLAEFIKIDSQVFHSEKGIEQAEASHGFSSEDIPQILVGVQKANEKLDGLAAQLRETIVPAVSEKDLLWVAPIVTKLRQEIKRLNAIPETPDLRGLTVLCGDLEQRLSSLKTQERQPHT